jgi:hypothetical protein
MENKWGQTPFSVLRAWIISDLPQNPGLTAAGGEKWGLTPFV